MRSLKKIILLLILTQNIKLNSFSFFRKKEKYPVPAQIKPILDVHAKEMAETFRPIGGIVEKPTQQFNWLPGFIVKAHGRGRMKGRDYCIKTIKKYPDRMSFLEVPQKYVYNNPADRRNQKYIIAEAVEGSEPDRKNNPTFWERIKGFCGLSERPRQLNEVQTQQLSDFTMKTGWFDLKRSNLAIKPTGHISIIDTQSNTFAGYLMPQDKINRKVAGIGGLELLAKKSEYLDPRASEYLKNRIRDEKASLDIDRWFIEEIEKNTRSSKK